MASGEWTRERIRAYLLGSLSADLTSGIEQDFAAEPDLFDLICSMELELIHDYLRKSLGQIGRAHV